MIWICTMDWCLIGNDLFQAFATGLVAFAGAIAGLFWLQRLKARYIGRKVELEIEKHHGGWTNFRIYNRSAFSMKSTFIYVSISHTFAQIDKTPPRPALIQDGNLIQLEEGRICWAFREAALPKAPHRAGIDIHPHERQTATFLQFQSYQEKLASRIAIASELGTQPYRIFLIPGRYQGLVKVVSADAYQAAWEFEIDTSKAPYIANLVSKRQLRLTEYENKLKAFRENFAPTV